MLKMIDTREEALSIAKERAEYLRRSHVVIGSEGDYYSVVTYVVANTYFHKDQLANVHADGTVEYIKE